MEAKTRNVLRLLQAACSRRVIAVPTTQVAARRWAAQTRAPAGSQNCQFCGSCKSACIAKITDTQRACMLQACTHGAASSCGGCLKGSVVLCVPVSGGALPLP